MRREILGYLGFGFILLVSFGPRPAEATRIGDGPPSSAVPLGTPLPDFGATTVGNLCTNSTVGNTFIEYDLLPNGPDGTPNCQGAFFCRTPTLGAPLYNVLPAGCDPETTSCSLEVRVDVTIPHIHQETQLNFPVQVFWFGRAQPTVPCTPPLSCNPAPISTCGLFGGTIRRSRGEAYLRVNQVSCDNLTGSRLRKYSLSTYACKGATGCEKRADLAEIDMTAPRVAAELGCNEPKKDTCNEPGSCETCLQCGVGASASAGGDGGGYSSGGRGELGPGAELRYQAGGVGGDGFPGTAAWRTELGLYWTHDYAERIVPDPDETHVWLLTQWGSFREFSDLSGGVYQTASPTDEYRTLSRTAGGWELTELDGTVHAFRADGRWVSTTDRFGNAKTAFYNATSQLERVEFPDDREETFTYHPDGKLATITEVGIDDTTTRTWSYTWDLDELTRVDRPDGTALEFFYDAAGLPGYLTRVEKVGTAAGRRVEAAWEYDAQGNVVALWRGDPVKTGPNALDLWELAFDNPNLPAVTTVTDPLGAESTYTLERDSTSRKPKLTNLSGSCPSCTAGANSTFAYADSAHPLRPTLETDGRGHRTAMTYDAHGQLLTRTEAMTEPEERTTAWTYHPTFPALVTEVRRPSTSGGMAERVTTWTYNASGALTERLEEGVEMPVGAYAHATAYTPSPEGETLVIDPPGFAMTDQTTFTYDAARGSLLVDSRTDPLVGTTTFGYDPFNRREKVTDPNLVETETDYDALDRVTRIAQLGDLPMSTTDDLITVHTYNEFGDLERTTLPEGNVLEYGYDSAGRLTSIERKPDDVTSGERTAYTLDAIGNRIKEELQRWNGTAFETRSTTDFEYKNRCQLEAVVYPDGTPEPPKTEYDYDCEGNLEKVWDANHPSEDENQMPLPPTTEYAYDALDRLITVTEPWEAGGSVTTSYGYDVQDHLTSVTDGEGNETTYEYSDRDLLTMEVSPVSGTASHTYNEHGELTQSTDARSLVTTRTVDELDRVTLVTYGGNPALTTTYTYDDPAVDFSKGRLTRIARGGSSVDYEYDRFGRMTRDGALGYTYDKNGNRLNVVYPDGMTAAYAFDFADREQTLTFQRPGHPAQGVVSQATYEPSGPLSGLTLGNGLTESRDFTNRYFPLDLEVAGASPLFDWTFATDAVGNMLGITDTLDATQSRTYAYQDFQYFLTTGNGPWGDLAWTYDRIGNRLTQTRDGTTETYTYAPNPTGGRTALLTSVQIPGVGTRTYQYDAAGHQIEEVDPVQGTLSLTYDEAGRLSSLPRNPPAGGRAQLAAPRVEVLYDGRSFLSSALVPSTSLPQPQDGVGATYSSEGLLLERRDILATDPAFLAKDESILYFAGRPVALFEREAFLPTDAGTLTYLTTDHLGTPVLATDTAGTEVWSGGFEPFGQDYSGAESAGIFLRLPGQWNSDTWIQNRPEGGIYYNVHRWYGPGAGRYTRTDPLGAQGDLHPYLYSSANPLLVIDPTGEKSRVCCTPVPFAPGPAKHCFIEHESHLSGEVTTYGLHRVRGKGCKYRNDSFDEESHPSKNPRTQCGPWLLVCGDKSCLDREFESYPNPSDYQLARGPNSNSFARTLANECGITPPSIAGERGQTPGWNKEGRPGRDKKFECPPQR